MTEVTSSFLQYHEPSKWLTATVFRAGLLGHIAVGIIFGKPLGDILEIQWQETFIALGYVGLILIIFEGGLTARLDLLKSNLLTSTVAAAVGSVTPIGLSFLLLYLGLKFGAVETFIVGASLSSTSLGTTLTVLKHAGNGLDMTQTQAGTVLLSAAIIDDIAGLIMASVIQSLGGASDSGTTSIGWLIGRPIVASVAMAVVTPLLAKFLFAPFFRKFGQRQLVKLGGATSLFLMACVLCAFLAIASYTGTSVLYGAFLAGTFLAYLPDSDADENIQLSFTNTFDEFVLKVSRTIFEPLFFASIGFAIPFLQMWTGKAIWQGIIYSILMLIGKLVVGLCLPLKDVLSHLVHKQNTAQRALMPRISADLDPALLVGLAMVARGEIGLLIIQIGYNDTSYLSKDAFVVAIWAIVLNTIIGPVSVGLLMKRRAKQVANGHWGVVAKTSHPR